MQTLPNFEDLLPRPDDPAKAAICDKLVSVLCSEGEILPSANSPRGKLWHLVNSPGASIDECEEVILLDSALASRIFRVANSGAYGVKAENISAAILRLGLKFVREQVFNAGIFKQYSGWTLPPEWDLYWLRSIFVARMCERIASKFGSTNGSEYLAGLIHDIGWLFLATYVPHEFTNLFICGKPVREAEKELLPFGHAEIGSAIAVRSSMPPRAIDAILHHHESGLVDLGGISPATSPRFLGMILSICDGIADCCHMDMFEPSALTLEEIQESPEVRWLNKFGDVQDLRSLAEEELTRSKEIFEIFFSNRKFN